MQAVIFDLDNTLYDISQYNYGAFWDIAQYLSSKYSLSEDQLYHKLVEIWHIRTSMYPKLLDEFLDEFDLIGELSEVIKIFNIHDGPLQPFSDVIPTLKKIKKMNCKIGLITDGNPQRQKRKINLLNINQLFDVIIFTSELQHPKPSEIPFYQVLNELKEHPETSCYVGDNPFIDFEGAKKVGLKTIRLRKGEFLNIPSRNDVDCEINHIADLIGIING